MKYEELKELIKQGKIEEGTRIYLTEKDLIFNIDCIHPCRFINGHIYTILGGLAENSSGEYKIKE